MHSERVLDSVPFVAKTDSELLAALETVLREKSLPVEREIKSGTTEAAVYSEAGMDAIIFGPGSASGNIHKPNEACTGRRLVQRSRYIGNWSFFCAVAARQKRTRGSGPSRAARSPDCDASLDRPEG